jgi:4-hydroxy-2-oxoheptanedioate aldolase
MPCRATPSTPTTARSAPSPSASSEQSQPHSHANTPQHLQAGPAAGKPQIGLWVGLADGYAAELLAGTGYDWLLVDGEHAPNDVRSVLGQLQGISSAWSAQPDAERSHPVVRIPTGDTTLIKQYLDIGAQTILVPMVDTAEQAARLVQGMRYPPEGIRGMGSALARASRWQAYPDYLHEANAQTCLLVQAETVEAMKNIDAIAATPGRGRRVHRPGRPVGVDGLRGPAQPPRGAGGDRRRRRAHPQGRQGAGHSSTTEEQARKWLAAGALFVAVGVDTILLAAAAKQLLAKYKTAPGATSPNGY